MTRMRRERAGELASTDPRKIAGSATNRTSPK